jgi:hypothetical protein
MTDAPEVMMKVRQLALGNSVERLPRTERNLVFSHANRQRAKAPAA